MIAEYPLFVSSTTKQHPSSGYRDGYRIDTTVTHYFIIDINGKKATNSSKVIGPLKQSDFRQKRKEWKLETIAFDQLYPKMS